MFGLFNKEKEAGGLDGMLGMLGTFLSFKGIDLQTMIPESAAKLHAAQALAGVQIVAMIGTNDNGNGYDLAFYRLHPTNGLQYLHLVPITDIASALQQLQSLPTTFTDLITQQNAISETNTDGAISDAAETRTDATATECGHNDAEGSGAADTNVKPAPGYGSADPLDRPDAE